MKKWIIMNFFHFCVQSHIRIYNSTIEIKSKIIHNNILYYYYYISLTQVIISIISSHRYIWNMNKIDFKEYFVSKYYQTVRKRQMFKNRNRKREFKEKQKLFLSLLIIISAILLQLSLISQYEIFIVTQ